MRWVEFDPFELARNQSVSDVVFGSAAIRFDGRAEPAARAKLGDDLAVEALVARGLDDARQQALGAISAHGVTQFALFVVELIFEQERVGPRDRLALKGPIGVFLHGSPEGPEGAIVIQIEPQVQTGQPAYSPARTSVQ